jgi:hypothetical protein
MPPFGSPLLVWEQLNNLDFNPVEFDGIKIQAGLNKFTLTPKQWFDKTGAVGIISRAGQYGGTFAHKDIAFYGIGRSDTEFPFNTPDPACWA